MYKSYTHSDLIQVNLVKCYLSSKGLDLEIREHLSTQLTGGESPVGFWPSLWSRSEDQHLRAKTIIENYFNLKENKSLKPWLCDCGENIAGDYNECWNCSSLAPVIS